MKRLGYIIEQIVDRDNMNDAFDSVLQGTKRKRTRAGRRIIRNREKVIDRLIDQIECDLYQVKGYREFEVFEHGKVRTIQSVNYEDRVALHAIMSVVGKHIKKRLIRDTYAAIPQRGILDGLNRVQKHLRDDREGTKYCYKLDVKKFYQSVEQDFVLYSLNRIFKDKRLINTLSRIIKMFGTGLSIGLRTSQDLGNLLLSCFLDHYIKDRYGVKHYFRYCDDIVILAGTKEELQEIAKKVHYHIESIGLEVKNNECIFDVEERGIDFLGYVIRHDYVLVRKRIKKNFARRIKKIRSRKRRHELIASFYGIVKHCNANHLFKTLTGMSEREIKKFGDLGLKWVPADGKKRFDCRATRIKDIVNIPIVIEDFEVDVTTKEGEHRHLVFFSERDHPEIKKKFFTNSEEMKNLLDQMRENNMLPVETTIKSVSLGNIDKYKFT